MMYVDMNTPLFKSTLIGPITSNLSLEPHSIVHFLFKFPLYPDLPMCGTFGISAASEYQHFKSQNSWACTNYFLSTVFSRTEIS